MGLPSAKAECEADEDEGEGLRDREEQVECDASEHVEGRRDSDTSDVLDSATMNRGPLGKTVESSVSCARDTSAWDSDANAAAYGHDNQYQVPGSRVTSLRGELTTRVALNTFWSTRRSPGGPKEFMKIGGVDFIPARVSWYEGGGECVSFNAPSLGSLLSMIRT